MTDATDHLSAALTGRYRIERELGAGGMATVYLAHDERHDRNVALKILKPELAAVIGAERFLVEIKTTANLQHPNILPLHDSGEVNGTVWYVMPLIEGESLRDRLQRETQLPIDDAIGIAREVASALDYAHRHGVIHRDIKPENILLHDGRAVVADFGIALAMSRTTGSTRLTETGMSLGTPHYMSPEQALGEKTIDARTDVYALGAVLYEMLVGEPPFTGPSTQAIIARVMNSPAAPISATRPTVPAGVEAAVLKALAKLPADRFRSAAEFSGALLVGAGTPPANTHAAMPPSSPTPAKGGAMRVVPWVVAAGALVAAAWLAVRGGSGGTEVMTAAVIPLEIRTPRDLPLNEVGVPFSISRDGSFIVYVGADPEVKGTTALWKRPLDRLEATPIPGTRGAQWPRITGDGKRVFFLARAPNGSGNVSRVIDVAGGIAQMLATASEGTRMLDDGTAVAFTTVEVRGYRTPAERQADTASRAFGSLIGFSISPDSQLVAWSSIASLWDSIRIGPIPGSSIAIAAGASPRFLDDRTLLYRANDGTLMAGRVNAERNALAAPPIAVIPGIATAGSEHAEYDVASDGTLIYVSGVGAAAARLTWVDAAGGESKIPGAELRVYGGVALAPDGRRAITTVGALTLAGDLWLEDFSSGTRTPVTTDGRSTRASWSADGKWISFLRPRMEPSARSQGMTPGGVVYQQEMGTAAGPDTVASSWPAGFQLAEYQWGPDRRSAAMRLSRAGTARDVYVLEPGATSAVPFAADSGVQERGPRFSPDGKWLAYMSDRSGRDEVYVAAFPKGGARVQVSLEGGREAIWSRDGSKIFYRAPDGWMTAATVSRSAAVTVTKRDRIFDASPYLANQFLNMYDVAPDGRFLMIRLDAEAQRTDVIVIRNWAQQVMARLKSGAQ